MTPATTPAPNPVLTTSTETLPNPVLGTTVATYPAPHITSIDGYSDGISSYRGRWTGQPSYAPVTARKYSNKYKGNLIVDVFNYGSAKSNPYYWDISGENFGDIPGSVWLTHSPSGPSQVQLTVISWKKNLIRVTPTAPISFTNEGIRLHVQTAPTREFPKGQAVSFDDKVVALIKSRGFGQCTWYVARKRLDQNLAIPSMAYSSNPITDCNGNLCYQPAQWDALTYGSNHVAIITEVLNRKDQDGTTTWTLKVEEMNAAWDESVSTSTRVFKLGAPDKNGVRRIITRIGTNASSTWGATGFYR